MRQEQSCLAIAVEEGRTECILQFECRANIVAKGPHKSAYQSQTNRRLAKVLQRETSLVFLCSKLPMLQRERQEAESSGMSMLAKVSLRENSLVFFGAELPML